jgi:O-antigen ligase
MVRARYNQGMSLRSWERPRFAAACIEASAIAYLVSMPFGPGLPPEIRNVLLLGVMAGLVLANRRSRGHERLRYQLTTPFLFFAASGLLSIATSVYPRLSLERSGYAPIAFLFFLAAQHLARDSRALRRLTLALTAVVLVLGIDGSWQAATGSSPLSGRPLQAGRAAGSLPHPNDLAVIPILLPYALSGMLVQGGWVARLLATLAVALGLCSALVSESRNAWLGIAIGISTLLVLSGRRRALLGLGAVVVAGFLLAVAIDGAGMRERAGSLLHWRAEGRIGVWAVGWRMFEEAPLLGKGVATFGDYYLHLLPEVELPPGVQREERAIPWAHNLYLEALAERGLLGLAALLVIAAASLRALRQRASQLEDAEGAMKVAAASSSLLVLLGMGVFDLTFLKDWVLLLFCLLVGVAAQLGRSSGSGPAAAV